MTSALIDHNKCATNHPNSASIGVRMAVNFQTPYFTRVVSNECDERRLNQFKTAIIEFGHAQPFYTPGSAGQYKTRTMAGVVIPKLEELLEKLQNLERYVKAVDEKVRYLQAIKEDCFESFKNKRAKKIKELEDGLVLILRTLQAET